MTYNYTIVDTDWRDCRPTYANMLLMRDEVNALDENNIDGTSSMTWEKLIVSAGFRVSQIAPAGDLDINMAENKDIDFQEATVTIFKVGDSGVQFG